MSLASQSRTSSVSLWRGSAMCPFRSLWSRFLEVLEVVRAPVKVADLIVGVPPVHSLVCEPLAFNQCMHGEVNGWWFSRIADNQAE